MNLYDMMAQAQGGQAFANLGRQFGLSEEQAQDAVRSLLPAFSSGLKRNTDSPEGIGSLLGALQDGRHERFYDDETIIGDSSAQAEGNDILGHMFGSKEVSRAVAARAAEQTGIGSEILKQMLPYIASMIMGALFKQGQIPLGDILGQIFGGGRQGGGNPLGGGQAGNPFGGDNPLTGGNNPLGGGINPFGPLADILMGGGNQPAQPQGRQPQNMPQRGTDIFGQRFDADGDGSVMDDIFDMLTKGRR